MLVIALLGVVARNAAREKLEMYQSQAQMRVLLTEFGPLSTVFVGIIEVVEQRFPFRSRMVPM